MHSSHPAASRAASIRFPRPRFGVLALALVLTLAALALAGTALAQEGVHPQTVNVTLAQGESTTIAKTVETSSDGVLPKLDVFFLADTTGSMGPAINDVKANAAAILSAIDANSSDSRYGAGDYKDFPDTVPPFRLCSGITSNSAAVTGCINGWFAGGGRDTPEGQFFALDQIANGAAGFRTDAVKVLIWFGDAPAHDPVCSSLSGLGGDITEGSVTAGLSAAGIKVLAISTTTGADPNALDGNPAAGNDYVAACGAPGGSSGQASRIAATTGGSHQFGVAPGDLAQAIIDGLEALPVTVAPSASCPVGISVAFAPTSATVSPGATASFDETVSVASGTPKGEYTCTVQFLVDGALLDSAYEQTLTVTVPNKPPVALDDFGQTLKNVPVVVDLLGNDSDADGDALTITNLALATNGTVVDNGDGTVTYTPSVGFSGFDSFTYTANDGTDDSNVATVTVEVINQAPDCSAAGPSIAAIWPPNHKFVSVQVLGVTDPDGDVVTITITAIAQDEPTDTLGDGSATPDGAGVGTSTAQVRAERAGTKQVPGDGRVYHIFYVATDDDLNNPLSCSGEVIVGVPHDQGGQSVPVDGGALYDSTI